MQAFKHSPSGLRGLVDSAKECTRILETLEGPVEHWDGIICFHIVEKLDSSSRQFWELSFIDTKNPSLEPLLDFLEQRARSLAASGITKNHSQHQFRQAQGKYKESGQRRLHVHHAIHQEQKKPSSQFCEDSHLNCSCPVFTSMAVGERHEAVKRHRLCFNRLRTGHSSKDCSSKSACKNCSRRHHTLIHLETKNAVRNHHAISSSQSPKVIPYEFSNHQKTNPADVILITALVRIKNKNKCYKTLRALLDSGSNISFITEKSVKRVGVRKLKWETQVKGIGSSQLGRTTGLVNVLLKSNCKDSSVCIPTTLYVVKMLTGNLPLSQIDCSRWTHMNSLELADPTLNEPGEIHILLGGEVFWEIVLDGRRRGPMGSPICVESKLGWLLAGRVTINHSCEDAIVNHATLKELLTRFGEIESVATASPLTPDEEAAEQHFVSTPQRDHLGRYCVNLPFKLRVSKLGSSREIAVKRFLQMEQRLKSLPEVKHLYVDFMRSYELLSHMEIVNQQEIANENSYYIPHHFISKDQFDPKKFRVVFDASAKTSSGVTLNDILMVGPTIQPTLVTLLIRFRRHPIAFTADIQKMYRQVLVAEEDQNYQRIVWRENSNQPLQDYKLKTVTYGTWAGSFLATRVLHQLVQDEDEDFPLATPIVKNEFYVDDLLSGTRHYRSNKSKTSTL